ncbi:MAG: hypothetical protein A3A51_00915 [Candidatus Levybacteria bacterium RIFCSPLOWO2_01_FULL_39_10]|nr:MAG: hypothetical protein A3A51_00915 [Candidatus Levybacteria bacterium RIFCSPLOWO2_01_FULL_39_10]
MFAAIEDQLNSTTIKKGVYILIIVGIIVYFFGLFNNFVIDDNAQIVDNPINHSINNFFTFFTGSTFYSGSNQLVGIYYKPITTSFFSLVYSIFGPNPFWFHLLQMTVHIANASILFLVLIRFFKIPTSLVLSLIFLVHPINSESVFYISASQEALFFLFGILGLWLIISYKSMRYTILAGVSFFLSLLSKETGMLFVLASILYAVLFNRKLLTTVVTTSSVVVFIYFFLRISAIGLFNQPMNTPIANSDLVDRLINIPSIIFLYIKTFVFPLNLSSSYQWTNESINFNNFFLPLFVDIIFSLIILFLGIVIYKKHFYKDFKIYLFFVSFLIFGLLLHSQILPLDSTAAERWFYFPIIGLLGIIGVFIESLVKKKWMNIILCGLLIIGLILSFRTVIRSYDWKDDFTLASKDIKVSKDAYDLEMRIAMGFYSKGNFREAKAHIERSIELYPYISNYNNSGSIYLKLGEYEKAKKAYLTALKFGDYYPVYVNLCLLSLVDGGGSKNMVFVKRIIQKFPYDSKLWTCLATLAYQTNNIESAKEAITKAYYYDQNSETTNLYNVIMNNKPLNLNIK